MSRNRTALAVGDAELRYMPSELETSAEGEQRRIGGVGLLYNVRSRLLPGGFYECIHPGAIAKSLGDKLDIACRLEHDLRFLLATTESNTLHIADDRSVGASYIADLPATQAGRDAYELVRTRRINHSSIGFLAMPGGDEFRHEGGVVLRHLSAIRLLEISPVSQPGYVETTAAVRSLAHQVGEDPGAIEQLAAKGELRTLFSRSDLSVTAPPTILPATEARSVTPKDLDDRLRKNRDTAVEFNRDDRLELDRLMQRNRQIGESIELETHLAANSKNMFPDSETRNCWWSGDPVPTANRTEFR